MAVHYFKLAADQGFTIGQFKYGVCLANGRGVYVDLHWQHFISSVPLIKDLPTCKSTMMFALAKNVAFVWICKWQHRISNLQPMKIMCAVSAAATNRSKLETELKFVWTERYIDINYRQPMEMPKLNVFAVFV
jgi:hypothetical protein